MERKSRTVKRQVKKTVDGVQKFIVDAERFPEVNKFPPIGTECLIMVDTDDDESGCTNGVLVAFVMRQSTNTGLAHVRAIIQCESFWECKDSWEVFPCKVNLAEAQALVDGQQLHLDGRQFVVETVKGSDMYALRLTSSVAPHKPNAYFRTTKPIPNNPINSLSDIKSAFAIGEYTIS